MLYLHSSQMHSSLRTLWWIILILLFVPSKGNKVLASSLVLEGCLIHIGLKNIPYFDSLILSNHFASSFALVGNKCKASLQHFKPSVLFFCRNSDFWLFSTNMEKIYNICQIAQYGKTLISIFQQFSASIKSVLSLGEKLSTRL